MANLTITLKSQPVRFLGPAPTTLWLSFNWGTGTWGIKSAGTGGSPPLPINIFKVWSGNNALSVTNTSANLFKVINRTWSGSNRISLVYANTDKEKLTGNGYHYVYIDGVTNIESAAAGMVYTTQAAGSGGWVTQAAASTTWS